MKRNYMSIIFIVFIIGLLSGILIKDYYKQEYLYINKDKLIKKEIKSTQKNIVLLITVMPHRKGCKISSEITLMASFGPRRCI